MITISTTTPLAPHTTFKIGGAADAFTTVQSEAEVFEALAHAHTHRLPVHVLGGGSNILVPDNGARGLVVHMGIMGITYEDRGDMCIVHAGAGVWFDDLVHETVARGLWGLENLSAIPGTVGASVIQNIGAYGAEVGDMVYAVQGVDGASSRHERLTLTREECAFGYRDSYFKSNTGASFIVTGVSFELSKKARPHLAYKDIAHVFGSRTSVPTQQEIRDAVVRIRTEKFPDLHVIGTAGSFFKNPVISEGMYDALRARYPGLPGFPQSDGRVKIPLAWILDTVLHVKGLRDGAVGAWSAQPLVLVNYGGASYADVDTFAHMLESRVRDATGLTLEREVRTLGV